MSYRFPDSIIEQHTGILGKTGSGKTSTGKLLVEQVVAAGARVCILDPIKSDWWGMISSASGKSAGLPFQILGGPHGHLPLHANAGKAIGEVVASGALPLSIIDMAEFHPGGHQQFFVDFAPTLMRKMKGWTYLVVEEAHFLAPKERSGIGQENMATYWFKMLATSGRSKGVRLIVLTQRTQALHNAVLGSCDTILAHRLTAPADQDPVIKWLKANATKEVMEKVAPSLSALKRGQAWVCSGGAAVELVQFPKFKTYDNTATPTGDAATHEVKTAPVDQEKLRALIGEAVKEAEQNDPRVLKRRIAELEKGKAPIAIVDAKSSAEIAELRRSYKAIATKAEWLLKDAEKKLRGLIRPMLKRLEDIEGLAKYCREDATTLQALANDLASAPAGDTREPISAKPTIPAPPQTYTTRMRDRAESNGDMPKGEAELLRALIQYPKGLDRSQLSVLTGHPKSTRNTYLSRMTAKEIVSGGDPVTAAEAMFT